MIERKLDDKVSVAPQIAPEDVAALQEQGITALICNRPDSEVMPDLSSAALGDAAALAGLSFAHVPLGPGGLTLDAIRAHLDAIDAASGPVLAYCASGTRSAYLWAFAMAMADRMTTDDILEALDRAGYPSPGMGPQLDQVRSLGADAD